MPEADKVVLVHPDLPDATYLADPSAVEAWAELGWKRQSKTAAAAAAKKEPTDG